MRRSLLSPYQNILLLGTAVHELAHALTVKLCGGTIDEIDLTSHVNHHGHYNLGHQIAISYAPLIVNTTIAAVAATWAITIPNSAIPQYVSTVAGGILPSGFVGFVFQLLVLIIAFVVAAAALPSYTDAKNPYKTFRRQLGRLTPLRVLTIPLALVALLVGVVPLIFSYLRSQSPLLHITSEITFAVVVLLQATGTIVIVDPAIVGDVLIEIAVRIVNII